MTAKGKDSIKSYFLTGDKPTQSQFSDLIDSYIDEAGPIGTLEAACSGGGSGPVVVSAGTPSIGSYAGLIMNMGLTVYTTALANGVVAGLIATTAQAVSADNTMNLMTPQLVAQAIAAVPSSGGVAYNAQSSTYAPLSTDKGALVDFTGASNATWTMTSAATLGNGWYCYLRNNGTSNAHVLLQSSSGTIDGLAANAGFVMYSGEIRLIQSNGTNFITMLIHGGDAVFTGTGTWTRPPGYSRFYVEITGGGGSGAVRTTSGNAGGGGGGSTFYLTIPASAFVSAGSTETITVGAVSASVASSNANGNLPNHSGITINGNSVVTSGGTAATNAATGSAATGGLSDNGIIVSVGNLNFPTLESGAAGGGVTTGNVASGGSGGSYTGGGAASTSSNNTAALGGVSALGTVTGAGNGGARGSSSGTNGGNGVAPGGGGGGAVSGGASGSGAAGQIIIRGII